MRKRTLVSLAGAALLAGAGVSCDDPTGPGSVAEVRIEAPIRSVLVGQSIELEGRAATTQAVRVDELVTWSISDPAIASLETELTAVDGGFRNVATVTGLAVGSATVKAAAQGKSHSVIILVSAPPAP